MLPKKHRLPKQEFSLVFRKGIRLQSKLFQYVFLPNRLAVSRMAVIVGKKYAKSAVKRNRIKRAAQEAFASLLPCFFCSIDMLCIAKKTADFPPYTDIQKDLETCVSKTEAV